MFFRTLLALGMTATLFVAGCETSSPNGVSREQRRADGELQARARTDHDIFVSLGGWKKGTYRNKEVLALATPQNVELYVSIAEQRGYLLVRRAIAMDFPVATGKPSHPTPTGTFHILIKDKDYHSNLYGRIFDQLGRVSVLDADVRTDPIPEGGKFVGAGMPYWMRLTETGVGLHIGYVPGVAASHGCVRLPDKVAPELFDLLPVGATVVIAEAPPTF
jgi:lipoprotein-anchoring transpeptidase ErfK/SrfK